MNYLNKKPATTSEKRSARRRMQRGSVVKSVFQVIAIKM